MNNYTVLIWATTILIIVIVFFFLFKKQIGILLTKTKKISYGNASLETDTEQTQHLKSNEPTIYENVSGLFTSATLSFFEPIIENETKLSTISDEGMKLKILHKYCVLTIIVNQFEKIHTTIFGSQIRILENLNTGNSESKESLERFYKIAAEDFPNLYAEYSYESYLNYLFNYNLITNEKNQIKITLLGVDFLKWMASSGKNVNKNF